LRKFGALWLAVSLLSGCSTEKLPPAQPTPLSANPAPLFPEPTELQRNQLARLETLLRGSITNLNLSWVADMGIVAIPTCLREVGDETLPVEGRDLILIVLGNTLKKAGFREPPDARNNLVVPVLLQALDDKEPRVQRSAAFAARFVDDARLVPALRPLLIGPDFVQEQAVLALGTSGRETEVLPIAKLFFGTTSGMFRYSCLYSLATMCLQHGVDVASVLQQNAGNFAEKDLPNMESVRGRFVEFKAITVLVKELSSSTAFQRREANENLRKLTGKQVAFDPTGDETTRAQGIEEWRNYFLKNYWLVPPPSKS
jgi:HEAT repeats